MAIRDGMSNLIARLRRLISDTSNEVWDNDDLQDVLDEFRVDIFEESLISKPQIIYSDDESKTVYHWYYSKYSNFEEATSGTLAWRVYDHLGETIGTANYTADYIRGHIYFTADQEGSARYLDARSYDIYRAAAYLWRERAGQLTDRYNISIDGHRMNRSEWFEHCMQMAERFEQLAGPTVSTLVRHDVNIEG